jgi:dGTPase
MGTDFTSPANPEHPRIRHIIPSNARYWQATSKSQLMSKMNWQTLLNHNRIGRRDGDFHNDGRSPFEVDFDRIIFSSAFRRLQDKTQVFPLSESDYVRTRLTHSLEVSCVGRSLGTMVGNTLHKKYRLRQHPSDIGAIVAAACLAHDLGNPPLGHSGEDAIRHWFNHSAIARSIKIRIPEKQRPDIASYEGNAQGFRLLTKIIHPDSDGGLQLTYATLAAMAKYPIQSGLSDKETEGKAGAKKYGFFDSEKASFAKVAEKTGLLKRSPTRLWWCRHPLAFLMEAADDICYRAVDFEDGYRLGLITYDEIHEIFCNILHAEPNALAGITAEKGKVQYLRARAIGELVKQATKAFLDVEDRCLDGSFDKELLTLIPAAPQLAKIKALTVEKIYSHAGVVEIEAAGFQVLGGLLDAFAGAAFAVAKTQKRKANPPARSRKLLQLVPEQFLEAPLTPHRDPYRCLMNIIDFVCGMTDSYAVSLYKKISGISLP